MDLANKVVIVTWASSGTGIAMGIQLAKKEATGSSVASSDYGLERFSGELPDSLKSDKIEVSIHKWIKR
ncbi:MAG: hypothetical protein ABI716_00980 [Candidatus Saccharibacteria bacterium]